MYRETKKYTLRNIALLNPVCFVRITIVFFSKVDILITNLLLLNLSILLNLIY